MYLEVLQAGGKYWRLKYRFNGKEKRLSLGVYPTVTLKEARDERDKAKKLFNRNINPDEHKKIVKRLENQNSFESVAREWHIKFKPTWTENHRDRILRWLEVDIFPWIGKRPINEINAPELLAALRRIESRGALETAHRTMQNCGQVFRYAVATGRAERNPTGDLKSALPPAREKHHASITDPKKIGDLLRAIDGYEGHFVTKCALKLVPLVFVRPGELRHAEWYEIDFAKKE